MAMNRLELIMLSIVWEYLKAKAFEHYAGIVARYMCKSSSGSKSIWQSQLTQLKETSKTATSVRTVT